MTCAHTKNGHICVFCAFSQMIIHVSGGRKVKISKKWCGIEPQIGLLRKKGFENPFILNYQFCSVIFFFLLQSTEPDYCTYPVIKLQHHVSYCTVPLKKDTRASGPAFLYSGFLLDIAVYQPFFLFLLLLLVQCVNLCVKLLLSVAICAILLLFRTRADCFPIFAE